MQKKLCQYLACRYDIFALVENKNNAGHFENLPTWGRGYFSEKQTVRYQNAYSHLFTILYRNIIKCGTRKQPTKNIMSKLMEARSFPEPGMTENSEVAEKTVMYYNSVLPTLETEEERKRLISEAAMHDIVFLSTSGNFYMVIDD